MKFSLRPREPEAHYLAFFSFAAAKIFLRLGEGFRLHVVLFILFLAFSLLDFLSMLAKHQQLGISVIFKNTSVNLEFSLHKHMKNTL